MKAAERSRYYRTNEVVEEGWLEGKPTSPNFSIRKRAKSAGLRDIRAVFHMLKNSLRDPKQYAGIQDFHIFGFSSKRV